MTSGDRTPEPVDVLAEIAALNDCVKDSILARYITLDFPGSVFDGLSKYLDDRMRVTSSDPLLRMTHVLGRKVYRISEAPSD